MWLCFHTDDFMSFYLSYRFVNTKEAVVMIVSLTVN